MSKLTIHDKKAKDEAFTKLLPIIEKEAMNDRNLVKKLWSGL